MSLHNAANNSELFLEQNYLQTPDNTRLFYSYAKQSKPSPLVFFVHGYSDHSGSFKHIMTWFYRQGYHVGIFDIRGHGRSSGNRGYVNHYDTYSHDLHLILKQVQACCDPTLTTIIAHSNGGLITTYYKLTHSNPVDIKKIVLCSPYFGLHDKTKPPLLLKLLWQALGKLYKYAKAPKPIHVQDLTHDPSMQDFFKHDKLRFQTTSSRWFFAAKEAQCIVDERVRKWSGSDLLLILAGGDIVVDNIASERFYDQIHINNKQCKHYPGLYHQILNETNSEDVYQMIYAWLEKGS